MRELDENFNCAKDISGKTSEMNHIGAKTEAAQTAWDQLAQTQNYEHPIRQQQSQTITSPSSAPKLPTVSVNNQTQSNVGQIQQQQPSTTPQPQQQQPEYGDELHPELVSLI